MALDKHDYNKDLQTKGAPRKKKLILILQTLAKGGLGIKAHKLLQTIDTPQFYRSRLRRIIFLIQVTRCSKAMNLTDLKKYYYNIRRCIRILHNNHSQFE